MLNNPLPLLFAAHIPNTRGLHVTKERPPRLVVRDFRYPQGVEHAGDRLLMHTQEASDVRIEGGGLWGGSRVGSVEGQLRPDRRGGDVIIIRVISDDNYFVRLDRRRLRRLQHPLRACSVCVHHSAFGGAEQLRRDRNGGVIIIIIDDNYFGQLGGSRLRRLHPVRSGGALVVVVVVVVVGI
jgi:hypothetical protein